MAKSLSRSKSRGAVRGRASSKSKPKAGAGTATRTKAPSRTKAAPRTKSASGRKVAPRSRGALRGAATARRAVGSKPAPVDKSSDSMVKIVLTDDHGTVETPWATQVGKNLYRLENTPFFAYGVSYRDVVEAKPQKGEPRPVFTRVSEQGGHATIRVAAAGDKPVPQKVIRPLLKLGCTFEGTSPSYLCFDIPPAVDLAKVVESLVGWDEALIQWEHANPTWDDLYSEVESADAG